MEIVKKPIRITPIRIINEIFTLVVVTRTVGVIRTIGVIRTDFFAFSIVRITPTPLY